MKMEMRG